LEPGIEKLSNLRRITSLGVTGNGDHCRQEGAAPPMEDAKHLVGCSNPAPETMQIQGFQRFLEAFFNAKNGE